MIFQPTVQLFITLISEIIDPGHDHHPQDEYRQSFRWTILLQAYRDRPP